MARRLGNVAGLDFYRCRHAHHYVPDHYGHSAHKERDILELEPFRTLADRARADDRTMLYYDKLYTLFQAVVGLDRFASAPTIFIADIGTFRGGSAGFLASVADRYLPTPVTLHCFDTFAGHPHGDVDAEFEGAQERARTEGYYLGTSAEEVARYLAEFPHVHVHPGRIQDSAVEVESTAFHLAHVDINLYEPTAFALSFLDRQMVPGGVIIVDDYASATNPGVTSAVDDFVASSRRYFKLHTLTIQCVLVRTS